MNSKRINSIQDPSANQDVATKNYVDTTASPFFYPNSRLNGRAGATIASNIDAACWGQLSISTQLPHFHSIYLKAGTVITNGLIYPVLAGNDIILYFGIYSKSGILLATSAQMTYLTGLTPINTMLQIPLTSTYTVPTTDFYYMCIYIQKQTSSASFAASNAGGTLANLVNFPQTSQSVNTGNLSLFRSASTNLTIASGPLWANLNIYTLQNLGQQIWLAVN